jgi:Phage related hypothetical protein (DUF1799)
MMPDAIEEMQLRNQSKDFEVWEENWDIVIMFLRMSTQWVSGFSGATGFNYQSLEWLCKLYTVKDLIAMFEGVQLMEIAALSAMNSKNK